MRERGLRALGAGCILLASSGAAAGDPPIQSTSVEVASDYSWGYKVGVKQPVGSYAYGRSVHQISRLIEGRDLGSPDYLIWVDEHSGEATILERPVGQVDYGAINPGGMAVFTSNPSDPGEIGRVWLAYGARADTMPFDLARSDGLFDASGMSLVLDDFISDQSSSTPCVHVRDDRVLFTYRNGASSWAKTTVRFRRYDAATLALDHEVDVGKGYHDQTLGNFGIEQLWTRYDPRYDRLSASWQWFYVAENRFGANPYVSSDDQGATWRRADGSELAALPVDYSQIDPVLVPFDHLSAGEDTNWLAADVGVTPGGAGWMLLPHGYASGTNSWTVYFWRWNGGAWEHRELTGGMLHDSKPYAGVVTRDFIVLAYSEYASNNELRVRVSRDDGLTWSEPVVVDTIPDHDNGSKQAYVWVSAIQPADRYLDNAARFVVGYYQEVGWYPAKRYENNIRWIKVQVGPRSDFNADAVVDTTDVIAYLNAWAQNSWTADFNDNGEINTIDFIAFLNAFAGER